MISNSTINAIVDFLVVFATDNLLPYMMGIFVIGVILRGLIYFTVTRENWFATEFQKRVHNLLDDVDRGKGPEGSEDFFIVTKNLMDKTYHEIFEKRAIMKRRRPDIVMHFTDRVFLIQQGVLILIKDTEKQIKYLKHAGHHPKLLEISKNVFQNNPSFSKVFGIIPVNLINEILNILPGLFIVGGIFGTFLGVMKALPELGQMDLANIEASKIVMDSFLMKLSFSMSTSIMGIVLSVGMTIVNTLLLPEKLFVSIIERFENSLDLLWNFSKGKNIDERKDEYIKRVAS